MTRQSLLDGALKLRHLVLIAALVDHGSIALAARHLRVTQPVATRSLQELEKIVGVRLFDRRPRGVTPTIYGEVLVQHARAVLTELRHAGEELADLAAGRTGKVTIGVHITGSEALLPQSVARFKRDSPRAGVVIRTAAPDVLLDNLASGRSILPSTG